MTTKTIDYSLLNRILIGFEQVLTKNSVTNYPPHNIIRFAENEYCIEVAVAGFAKSEISVKVTDEKLIVTGEASGVVDTNTVYIHRGLASRSFEQTFTLTEHMVVDTATITDGVLRVYIKRILPDVHKYKTIEII